MSNFTDLENSFREWWAAQGYAAKPNPHTVTIASAWASTLLPPEPATADGPAVPEGREPASVASEPSDEDIMEMMSEEMRADLAAAACAMAEKSGSGSPRVQGLHRIILNRHAVDLARAVLARWGTPNLAELRRSLGDPVECQAAPVPVGKPGEEYHDDMGPVTWWRFPVDEPPWVGTPNDSDWPGYHTHFTPAPPEPINAHDLPVLPEDAHVIEPSEHTILVPVPVPVAVNERLPGPEDCDVEGRCWVHQPHYLCPESPAWELMSAKYASANYEAVCWLPANALPIPEQGDH